MATRQELQVQQKRELENKEESTIPTRVFLPTADIYETSDALNVVIEMPGVEKSSVDIRVEDGVLKIGGRLDFSKYQGLQPTKGRRDRTHRRIHPWKLDDEIAPWPSSHHLT